MLLLGEFEEQIHIELLVKEGAKLVCGDSGVGMSTELLHSASHAVVLAVDDGSALHDTVAKVHIGTSTRDGDSFKREARIATDVSLKMSAHAARVFETHDTSRLVVNRKHPDREVSKELGGALIMERLRGESLLEYIRKRVDTRTCDSSGLNLDESAELLLDAGEGLGRFHDLGYVHRDVKPGNFFVSEKGHRVRLIDFGIATEAGCDELPVPDFTFGTPGYMSPEAIECCNDPRVAITPESDLFSLGQTLYDIHFIGAQRHYISREDYMQRLNDSKRSGPWIPEDRKRSPLVPVVRKLMQHEPQDRYQSAAELCDDVQAILDERRLAAFREAITPRGWKLFDGMVKTFKKPGRQSQAVESL